MIKRRNVTKKNINYISIINRI